MKSKTFPLFKDLITGTFISREKRFIVYANIDGKKTKTYMPNPGRLKELLLPNTTLLFEKSDNLERKIPLTLIACKQGKDAILLHTHKTNDIAEIILREKLIPELKNTEIVKREAKHGRSRFDFLLKEQNHKGKYKEQFAEVKSVTLFSKNTAMFPDAVTERGKRHLEELALLSGSGQKPKVFLIAHRDNLKYFLPDFHTDLQFAKTFLKVKDKIDFFPLSVSYDKNLNLKSKVTKLEIPFDIIEKEAKDRGNYLLIAKKKNNSYEIFIGTEKKDLSKKIKRLKNKKLKNKDYAEELAHSALSFNIYPILTSTNLEKDICEKFSKKAQKTIKENHFIFKNNPENEQWFFDILFYFRIDRLLN